MKKCILLLFIMLSLMLNTKAQSTDTIFHNTEYAKAVAWTRNSGEFRALNFQAYNFAKISLDNALKTNKSRKPKCIVVDIDETVLDNSAYYEYMLKEKKKLDFENWKTWLLTKTADTIPGALAFLRYAATKKVEVFYVTNRQEMFNDVTLKNLRKFGFPNADAAHYYAMVTTHHKTSRRESITTTHEILLLAGDNLSDFNELFYKSKTDVKNKVNLAQDLFGKKFIILPNSIYGSWKSK